MNSFCVSIFLFILLIIETVAIDPTWCGKPVGVECDDCTDDYRMKSECSQCKCAAGYLQERKGSKLVCISRKYSNGTVVARWRGKLQCRKVFQNCTVDNIKNLASAKQRVTHGDSIQMECADGHYQLHGANVSRCLDGNFYPTIHDVYCHVVNCGLPRRSPHLKLFYTGSEAPHYRYGYNSTVTYQCTNGLTLFGRKTRQCQANGKWEGKEPRCRSKRYKKDCIVDNITNLAVAQQVVKHGDSIRMECTDGHYKLYGENVTRCRDGQFFPSIHDVHCQVVTCGLPPVWSHRLRVFYTGSEVAHYRYGYGSTLTYSCTEGFTLKGRKTRQCQANGEWEGTEPRCRRGKLCQPTADGPSKPMQAGTNVTLPNECSVGLVPVKDVTTWTCMRNGTWRRTPANVLCVPSCNESPPTIKGARLISAHKDTHYRQGDEVKYKCKRRHKQVGGNATRLCSHGQWQGQDIICFKEDLIGKCKPMRPKNGYATARSSQNSVSSVSGEYRNGDVIMFHCNFGYRRIGSTEAVCKGPKWRLSDGIPRCKRVRNQS